MALIPYRMRRFDERISNLADRVGERAPRTAFHCQIEGDGSLDAETAADIVSDSLFTHGAKAIGVESRANGDLWLIAGFDDASAAEAASSAVVSRHPSMIATAELASHDPAEWVDSQREGLSPTEVGGWLVRAPWQEPDDSYAPERTVTIDPGVAFGHGAHPSTRLALELVLERLRGAEVASVVDIGTGTGVIAIVAARSGVRVRAVESDERAADVAWANIDRNGVDDRIELLVGDGAELAVDEAELVVANVTLDVQRKIAATCRAAQEVVLSGLLDAQVGAAVSLYPNHVASTIRTHDGWAAVYLSSRRHDGRRNT